MTENLKTQATKNITLTPHVVERLKTAGLTADRIATLYLMGELDLLKSLDGITDKTVSKLRALLSPDEPIQQEYCWVYRLALSAFFGEVGLDALLYCEPNSQPLIDRAIIATHGTEEVFLNYLKQCLKPSERKIIEEAFRWNQKLPHIARQRNLSIVRVRQVYHKAMTKLSDEDGGIADDLLALVFRSPESETDRELTVIEGKENEVDRELTVIEGKTAIA